MSNVNYGEIHYNTSNYAEKDLNAIKNEFDNNYNEPPFKLNSDNPKEYRKGNDERCFYNSSATVPNTILITNNYSQDNGAPGLINKNVNKSSITIVTHNSDADPLLNTMPTSSTSSTVVLDRINICINNHFNDSKSNIKKSSLLPETAYQSEAHKIKPEPDSTTNNVSTMRDLNNQQEPQTRIFSIGEDVLVQRKDARFYLGTIVAIGRNQCLVKFDDNTEYWSNFEELSKLSASESNNDPMCVVCKKVNKSDIVEVCERCGRGYHRHCTEGSFQKNGIWYCRRCTAPNGFRVSGKNERNILEHKSQLPYDVDSLSWDDHHRVNLEQIYCYCGKNGEWYNRMLQCCKCENWFHEDCVSCLNFPLFAGDRFFVFACSMCNGGKEFLRRIEMKWIDIVHLILFNITKNNQKKYYHASRVIVPYAIDNWPLLQLQPNMRNLSATEIRDNVIKTLSLNSSRFKCGREIKKGTCFYGLRTRIPPPPTKIIVNSDVELTDQYIQQHFKLNVIPLSCLEDIPNDVDAKMRSTFSGENSDNETSSTSSEQKSTSDDEIPLQRIIEKQEMKKELELKSNVKALPIKNQTESNTTPRMPVLGPLGADPNNFSIGDISDKSRDTVDFEGTKDDESMDVDVEEVRIDPVEKHHVKHSRKRKSPFLPTLIQQEKMDADVIEIYDSSDETSSRGTLDLIIPPPKNFQGKNNPFRLTPKKKEDNNNESKIKITKPVINRPELFQSTFKPKDLSQTAAGQLRIVRTVKRRLSAKDIMIGPNKEIKRRRLRRRSGKVEVISTTTLQALPKSAAYLPLRTDSKELPLSLIRSSLNSTASSTTMQTTTPTSLGSISNVFSGRRLRQRREKNYSDSQRRNSNSSIGTVGSNSGSSGIPIPGSPNKSGNQSDVSLSELKTSVNMYFGAPNRIANGESFAVKAKRFSASGKVQYLIEWEGIS